MYKTYEAVRENYHELWCQYALGYAAFALVGVGISVFGALTPSIYLKCYWTIGLFISGACIVSVANPHLGSLTWLSLLVFLFVAQFPEDPEIVAGREFDPEYGNSPLALLLFILILIATGATIYKCTFARQEEIDKRKITARRVAQRRRESETYYN